MGGPAWVPVACYAVRYSNVHGIAREFGRVQCDLCWPMDSAQFVWCKVFENKKQKQIPTHVTFTVFVFKSHFTISAVFLRV